jgi:hypothetical protein
MNGTPELEPIVITDDHQERIDADLAQRADAHEDGMRRVLEDAQASARRITARFALPTTDDSIYGEHCVVCEERWCLPADKATCAHMPVCEDCWPNGCEACEREVEEGIRRREQATNRIVSAALELRTGADDLSEVDLTLLDWRARNDVLRHIELSLDAMRRVRDTLAKQGEPT